MFRTSRPFLPARLATYIGRSIIISHCLTSYISTPNTGRPEDEIPQSTHVPHFTGTGYAEIQQARWNSLIQARIRVEEARQKFSDASTLHSNVAPALTGVPGWKDATIESYRLQFRIIDLNGDGLIDFKEM